MKFIIFYIIESRLKIALETKERQDNHELGAWKRYTSVELEIEALICEDWRRFFRFVRSVIK